MAIVFLVRQPALDRYVVLKRLDLDSDDPRHAQRFVQEARLAARLEHPNVVTLFDFFEDAATPYIAMEYVAGGSLRQLVGVLALPQVIRVVEGMLAGLGHAERHGIAHRDLKPENVLLTGQGEVKLSDFGIARAYQALTGRLTSTGMAIGTPAYMSPEQAQDLPLGPPTDLYAVGVIVYELLAGRPPFEADTPVVVLYRHVHEPPPPLTNVSPAIRGWVEWLLAKSPAERPQSAAEAWEALEEIAVAELGPYWRRDSAIFGTAARPARMLPENATTASAPIPAPEALRSRRRRWWLASGAAAVAAAGTAIALVADGGDRDTIARQPQAAVPYDFDGDGRQQLVAAFVTGSAPGAADGSGVVLLQEPAGRWTVISPAEAGIPGAARRGDEFGSGLASGDFNADGHADLAIGMPGKDHVAVLYGSQRGLLQGRRQQLGGAAARLPRGAGRYGYALLARDFSGDRFDELVIGAPGGTSTEPGAGAIHLLPGSRAGLVPADGWTIRQPEPDMVSFGSRLRAGDVDGDSHADLIEGSATRVSSAGHTTYCAGAPRGPAECRKLGTAGATSLAVADVNGDGRADVVQGDAALPPAGTDVAGKVLLWLGGPEGPRDSPILITQSTPSVPGRDEPGDRFGAVVDAGDVDGDKFADMLVGAPGEDKLAGRITVIRGGRNGYASTGHSSFGQEHREVPGSARAGRRFGSALAVLKHSDDPRPDLAVAARGEGSDERIMVINGGPGAFAPDETRTTTVERAGRHVRARPGVLLRLARTAGG